jgi:hypothetical protein
MAPGIRGPRVAQEAIDAVRALGDTALTSLALRFDGCAPLTLAVSAEEFASLTAGQNRRDIEDITLRAGDQMLTRKLALDRGQELMDVRYGSVLKRLEPAFGFEGIGGNDTLKEYLMRKVIRQRASIKKGVPMGMLLSGPPGTGKSAVAVACAKETGVNAIEIMNLKDKWVGASERNLEILIEGCEMFAPTFLFIDEYDKAFGSSGGQDEHPVDAALQKRLQEWLGMESHRGWIFLMGATNYPENVPPAMMRTGRIDVKAALLAPGARRSGSTSCIGSWAATVTLT